MTDKVQKIREEVERLKGWNNNVHNSTRHMTLQEEDFNRGKHSSYLEILNFIDSLQEEPVSEELEKVADQYSQGIESDYINDMFDRGDIYEAVIYGAQWQKQQDDEMLIAAYMKGAEEGKEQMMKEMPKWKGNWLGHTKKPCIADEIPGHNGKQLCVAGKCISIDDLWTKLSKED